MYSGRIAATDSDEMSVSIETMPRLTTVDRDGPDARAP